MSRTGCRFSLAGVLALVVALAGCGSDAARSDAEASPSATAVEQATPVRSERNEGMLTRGALGPIDVWTWIGQSRHLEGTKRITVPVRFESDGPVTVLSIAVRAPHFDALPPEPKDSLIHPDRKVDLQVDLGPARCGPIGDTAPEVELTVRLDDAEPTDVVLPVPRWLLDDLRERECALAALADAVDVGFGEFSAPDGIAVETELVIERRSASEPIVVERMAGSVLLTLEPQHDGTPVATSSRSGPRLRIPVDVTATRCDAHGLAGSQRTFVFSVWLAIGDAPAVYVEVRPEPALEAAMRATLDACVQAGGR